MAEDCSQFDFWSSLELNAVPEIKIVKSGKRFIALDTGTVRLEGTPEDAAKIIGIPKREIYRLIEDGTIWSRCPKRNIAGNLERRDSQGRKISFRLVVDLKDAFRIRFGRENAERTFKDLGLN